MDAVPVQTLQIASTDIKDPTTISRRMRIPVEECELVWSTLQALLITHSRRSTRGPHGAHPPLAAAGEGGRVARAGQRVLVPPR